ncbi:MAG: hypothetical protein B1H03_02310 [Planctomycetales bacterium 4484_113]|nr:MAG: hypothetical protein B1H03_02310 [Planctomycetales bacterium 4484_113]
MLPGSPDIEVMGRLTALLQDLYPWGLAFFDEHDVCHYANSKFVQMLNRPADDVLGNALGTLLPGTIEKGRGKPPSTEGFAATPGIHYLERPDPAERLILTATTLWQDGEYRGVIISANVGKALGKPPGRLSPGDAGVIPLLEALDHDPCWRLISRQDSLSFGLLDSTGNLKYLSARARQLLGLTAEGELPQYNPHEDTNFERNDLPVLIKGALVGEEVTSPPIEYHTDWRGAMGGLAQRQLSLRFAFFPVEDRTHGPLIVMLISRAREPEPSGQPIVFLQRSESASMLARGVAHEFNNVFASIQAVVDLLETEIDPGQTGYAYLKKMSVLVDRGVRLIRDLTGYVRISEPALLRTDVKRYFERFAQLARLMVPSSVKLEVNVSAEGAFEADRKALDQALFNIIHNAVEALADCETKKIELKVEEYNLSDWQQELFKFPQRRVLSVSLMDSGPGLTEEVRQHLFEPYFSTKNPQQSSGLGLSVTQQIIRRHSGVIFAEPKGPLGGAVFTVYLPFSKES